MHQKQASTGSPLQGARGWLLVVLAAAVLSTVGCRGCRTEDPQAKAQREAEEKKRKEEEEKKFEIGSPIIQPSQDEVPIPYVKPGHWVSAAQHMTANQYDFVGGTVTKVLDRQSREVPIDRTPFALRSGRPVALIKGRPKAIETLFFVPPVNQPVRMVSELRDRNTGVLRFEASSPLTRLAPYQYLIVVLATEPERYTYLKHVDAVKVPFDGMTEFDLSEDTVHYHVVQPDLTDRIPLADNPLAWTGIAYILWDEVDPNRLAPDQEAALLDWLHWGGQLIVNGPDSLDLLAGSFLEPYLPAASTGSRAITAVELAELNRNWTVPLKNGEIKPLEPQNPWSGVSLEIHPDATVMPSTGELLVERDVGLGRIVVSAMQLSERELINWNPHFQSWLNACLLRRPPREYQTGMFGDATLLWADEKDKPRRYDARLTCGLRFFSRDVGVETNYQPATSDETNLTAAMGTDGMLVNSPGSSRAVPKEIVGGVAAWNDFSAPAEAARAALREAAGVEVPGASFVVACLAAYLVVLVPLNWLVFHALGRVEWAWIAAPIIAVATTLVVVHRAQLDIGFVRAQTEIGVMEVQPAHHRAHLTRYTALYTSLSTTYDIEFENRTTLAAPFPTHHNPSALRMRNRSVVTMEKHDQVRLKDMPVTSNSTDAVHSEQMLDLGGAIQLGTSSRGHPQVENHSTMRLVDVAVVRRSAEGAGTSADAPLEGIWIGELGPGESRPVSFPPITLVEKETAFAAERKAESQHAVDRLNIDPLIRLAYEPAHIQPGETRLVGRIDGMLPGQTIAPAASQVRAATLVVAHLEYPPRPAPRSDVNAASDVIDHANSDDLEFADPPPQSDQSFGPF